MSKIYEALLRAEQERNAGNEKQPPAPEHGIAVAELDPSPVVRASDVDADYTATPAVPVTPSFAQPTSQYVPPAPPPLTATAEQTAAFPVASTTGMPLNADQPIFAGPGGAPRLDVNAIRRTEWHPLLQKLPALEERGNSVEQFRSLRTRIFGFRDLNKLRSIMISSGLPREGKSFIAANLAVSFARHKASRVLLIDGDMRRSALHKLFGCDKTPGLTTYLAGHASMVEIMQRPILPENSSPLLAGLGSITFIGGGDEGDMAADLAGSSRFKQLIDTASSYFDWIIVDSSPVNLVTDGVNLAAACDAVLMVARGGVTKFESAQRALAELKASRILGVVLNAIDDKASENYYGYEGYGGYDSYETEEATPEPAAQ